LYTSKEAKKLFFQTNK